MAKPLTNRQVDAFSALVGLTKRRGFPPTLRELADAMGLKSVNSARSHLLAIQRKGWIAVHQNVARGIVLTADGDIAAQWITNGEINVSQ